MTTNLNTNTQKLLTSGQYTDIAQGFAQLAKERGEPNHQIKQRMKLYPVLCLKHGFAEVLKDETELTFFGQDLDELHEDIGLLTGLKKLILRGNNLTTLPTSIGRLINLEELNLHNNQITSLPDEITLLGNLKDLCVSVNQLESLPNNIGNLRFLESLDLEENNLKTLPISTANLNNLQDLLLWGNPIGTKHQEELINWLPNTDISF